MPYDAVFDATQVQPQQGGGRHPPGNKFPFEITSTLVKPVKSDNPNEQPKGGLFEVEFTSPAGSIKNIYNLWNQNDTTRKIAQQELSALCHAVGRFQIDFKNDGAVLRGGRGLMDIGFQKGHEPTAEKPEGGYVELKKVYDSAGNEPGKANVQQQPQTNQQGATQQPNGQWSGNPNTAQQQQPQTNVQSGWSGGGQPQTNQQPQGNQGGGWSQGPSQGTPPWKAS